jgi:hypothetical protein
MSSHRDLGAGLTRWSASLPLSLAFALGASLLPHPSNPSLLTPQAHATVAKRATLESLTRQADLVARVVVREQVVPKERGPRGEIYTRSTLEVLELMKGEAPPTLTLQQLGGTLQGVTLAVSGSARLLVGQEVVLFLKRDEALPLVYLLSLAQGAYFVGPAPAHALSQDLRGVTFYAGAQEGGAKGALRPLDAPEPTLTLDALRQRVRAVSALPAQAPSVEVLP